MTPQSYELSAPEVVGEKFQEGVVILNLDTGTYFDVGDRLVPLLAAFEAGHSLQSLQIGLDLQEPGAGDEAAGVVAKMVGFGLLRGVAARLDAADPTICAAILAAGPTFFIESHSDLAELIAADPVHDIDPTTGRMMK